MVLGSCLPVRCAGSMAPLGGVSSLADGGVSSLADGGVSSLADGSGTHSWGAGVSALGDTAPLDRAARAAAKLRAGRMRGHADVAQLARAPLS